MLKIRLQRVGRKHEPTFRLVLTDSKNSTKSGKFEELLGSYDPRKNIDAFKSDRIKHWLSQGVSLTGSVNNLLIKHGIIRGKKTHVGSDFVVKAEEPVVEESAGSSSDESASSAAEESAPVTEPASETSTTPEETSVEAPAEAAPDTEEKAPQE